MEEIKTDNIKRLLMVLAGGLIFIFGILGIVDLTTNKLDQDITNIASNTTTTEDFDTTK